MHAVIRWGFILLLAATLAACAQPKRDAAEAERRAAEAAAAEEAERARREAEARAQGLGMPGTLSVDSLDDPQSPLSGRLVYFEYDSDTIRPEFIPMLEAHSLYLSQNPNARVRLEGHTDERGTREYNLALGERRAQAVRRVMNLNGARDNQLEVISFGEEMPVAFAQTEDAWAQNRRVEIVYEVRR